MDARMDVLYFLADYCYITITSNLPLKNPIKTRNWKSEEGGGGRVVLVAGYSAAAAWSKGPGFK